MRVKNYGNISEVNFLASAEFTAFTEQISDVGVVANAQGRKVVPAGTIFPANDATARGIVYKDVDVTEGPQPGSVIATGWFLEARLPVAPAAAAKTAMTGIKFKTVA